MRRRSAGATYGLRTDQWYISRVIPADKQLISAGSVGCCQLTAN